MIFVQVSIYLSHYLEKRLWKLNPLKGYQDTLACSLAMNQKSVNVPRPWCRAVVVLSVSNKHVALNF